MENEKYFEDKVKLHESCLESYVVSEIDEYTDIYDFQKSLLELQLSRQLDTDEVLKLMQVSATIFLSLKQKMLYDKLEEVGKNICIELDGIYNRLGNL